MPILLTFLGRYRTTERATTRATFFRQGVFGMADYLVKRDGFWHFVRRVPKHYETTDQHGIVRETTKVRVADDPRAVRARKVAAEINASMERRWRDFVQGDQNQALADYEAARRAARRLDISAPIDDAAQRTIAELLARIEKLEGKHEEDRHAVLAVYDVAAKPDITFRQCAERYIEAHKAGWKNSKHAAQWTATLKTYAYPIIGPVPVKKLTNGDGTDLIMKVLEPIWYSKTETASRVRGRIETILDWAKARGFRDGENRARWKGHLDKLLPAKNKVAPVKHHRAMPFADVPGFMGRLRQIEGTAARALEFTVLTAARTSEVTLSKRSEIDRKARMWIVPERMKAGREHRVPLCDAALAIIDAMPPDSDWLFPGAKAGKPLSNMSMQMTLRRMGVADQAVTHGFRSTFRDWAAETTHYPNEVLEMALAHTVSNKVEAASRRGDLLEKRHALIADWCSYCNGEA
jgi:integrase